MQNLHDVIAYRNCPCGSTITIQCALGKSEKKELMNIIAEEARIRKVTPEDVAQNMRDKVIEKSGKKS